MRGAQLLPLLAVKLADFFQYRLVIGEEKNEGLRRNALIGIQRKLRAAALYFLFIRPSKQEKPSGEREDGPHSRHLICRLNYVYRFGWCLEVVTYSPFTHQRSSKVSGEDRVRPFNGEENESLRGMEGPVPAGMNEGVTGLEDPAKRR